jgi:hypothetical protein
MAPSALSSCRRSAGRLGGSTPSHSAPSSPRAGPSSSTSGRWPASTGCGRSRSCVPGRRPTRDEPHAGVLVRTRDRPRTAGDEERPIDYPAALDNDYEIWSAFDKAESPRPRSSFLRRLRRTPKANRRLNARLCGRSRVSPSLRSRSRDLLRSSAVGSCTSSCGQETGSYLVTYQEADLFA